MANLSLLMSNLSQSFHHPNSMFALYIKRAIMKTLKTLILFGAICSISNAQVGINTTAPQATMDIVASNVTTPSYKDGLIIPRMHAFPVINPDVGQNAMMVFITGDGAATKGFYFWDNNNTAWTPLPGRDNSRMFLNPQYPDGMAGMQPITHDLTTGYTVPSGKNLYITNYYSNNNSALYINSVATPICFGTNNEASITTITNPIIIGSGDSAFSSGNQSFNGFLVDAYVSPITIPNGNYTVPSGKVLVILSALGIGSASHLMYINGDLVFSGLGNTHSITDRKSDNAFFQPIFADAGDVVDIPAMIINGYLINK